MSIIVNVKLLRDAAEVYGGGTSANVMAGFQPATEYSVGIDLRACFESDINEIIIASGERFAVGSGIAIAPMLQQEEFEDTERPGYGGRLLIAGFVYSRSGLGAKHGLVVAQGVGVIDPDYRGEIIVWLLNNSKQEITLRRGDRMAQLVFLSCCQPVFNVVDELGITRRGAGGFGHTGK